MARVTVVKMILLEMFICFCSLNYYYDATFVFS